jgi:hypothetical protein
MDDVIELVRGDHARIGRLFEELAGAAGDPPRLAALWAELAESLLAHVGAFQEICLLPLRHAAPGSVPSAEEVDTQRLDICEAVAEARLLPAGSARWWLAVRAARAAADRHVSSVEAGPLPGLVKQVPESARRQLGRQWNRYMADLSDDRREEVWAD